MSHAFHIAMARGFAFLGGLLAVYLVACGAAWVIGWLFERAAEVSARNEARREHLRRMQETHGDN